VLGCVAVFGCFFLPERHASTVGLAAVSSLEPIEKTLASCGRWLSLGFSNLASFTRSGAEVRKLRVEVAELRERLEAERSRSADKDRRLQMLSEFASHRQNLTVTEAEVMGEGAGAERGILYINRGSKDGLREGMAVVAGQSVVGRICAVNANASAVLLVTSRGSRLDGQVTSTGEPGVVIGNGDGTMRMKYVSQTLPKAKDGVVTRGRDGLTPRHFLLGTVVRSRREPGLLTCEVVLKPVRNLDQLASVLVVRPTTSAPDFPRPTGEHVND
jgi:rod shape-determining protein MreC